MVVSLDTMVMIWGVKRVATPGQEHMIDRAKRFLADLRANKTRVIMTAPVVAEYVGEFPLDKQPEQFKVIQEQFSIYPFDIHAAAIAAKLLYPKELIKDLQAEFKCSRQVVKADMQIVAASIAAGADTLFSNDVKVRRAAQGKIIVKEFPDIQLPQNHDTLF